MTVTGKSQVSDMWVVTDNLALPSLCSVRGKMAVPNGGISGSPLEKLFTKIIIKRDFYQDWKKKWLL